jgi:hypothetical protein
MNIEYRTDNAERQSGTFPISRPASPEGLTSEKKISQKAPILSRKRLTSYPLLFTIKVLMSCHSCVEFCHRMTGRRVKKGGGAKSRIPVRTKFKWGWEK